MHTSNLIPLLFYFIVIADSRMMKAREDSAGGFGSKHRSLKEVRLRKILSTDLSGSTHIDDRRANDISHYVGPTDRMVRILLDIIH
jgi:hypothetical protein